ncbi:MAG: recombinase family protein [Armatimonadetes bacterium]|nr:recombinase family protein [Armatimonadota bacterium]
MLVGYARTSTLDQIAGFEAQQRDLQQAGVEKVFAEQVSSVAQREELEAAMEFVRDGDTLVVTKLDRLARSTMNLLQLLERLQAKKVGLRILDFGGGEINTNSPNGKLILTMFSAFGQFERELMLERQREGIARAKTEGKYKGRKATAMAKADEVRKLKSEGIAPTQIAKTLGIGRASVYRILADRSNA